MSRSYLKPGKLVLVSHPGETRRFHGEVMSFPTPDDTIMVRQFPTFPGTLIEVPLSNIECESKVKYLNFAYVDGRGFFPADMLRYDVAVPLNFTIDSDGRAVLDPIWEGTRLMVGKATDTKTEQAFTVARWSSFNWGCEPFKQERITHEF